ncbi:MAG: M23 family metallopeptidase, partial [Ignavibacteriota bacterium]
MKTFLILSIVFAMTATAIAQEPHRFSGSGGGGFDPNAEHQPCLTAEAHERIIAILDQQKRLLSGQGKNQILSPLARPSFDWPLRQAAGRDLAANYGISNFIDHDPTFPSHVRDYTGGTRTYDLSSGYNHQGTDIFLWPFAWEMMDHNDAEIVAAADGVILYKSDGNFDKNCAFNDGDWNAVYLQHSDGSVTWYGHMKKGTQTAKPVGASVLRGEFLGNVG